MNTLILSHNEAALLLQMLKAIREGETPQRDENQEIVSEVSFRYKDVEQRLVENVLSKLSEIKQPKVISTRIGS
jgi:hypothetical protein